MNGEWKKEIARNLDRELEIRGLSNSEQARWAYNKHLRQLFGWLKEMAQEVQKTSLNPGAVVVFEERDSLSLTIGTEVLRLKAKPYPFCARGWGKIGISSTSPLSFNEIILWSKGGGFTWLYNSGSGLNSIVQSDSEVTREVIEDLFRQAFKKYIGKA